MFNAFQEIFSTLKQNKLRAIMTGFSVAWGIFMLILLLGSGNGLQHGMENNFRGTAKNALWIWSRQTQVAHEGLQAGRRIQFTDEDYDMLVNQFNDDLSNISGRFRLWGSGTVTYKNEYGDYDLEGVMPEFQHIQIVDMEQGRYLNKIDLEQFRKVAIISVPVKKALFKEEDPIGKYIHIDKVPFMVVGTFINPERRDDEQIYIPVKTAQRVFNGGNRLNQLAVSTNALTVAENKRVEEAIRSTLMKRHRIAPEDKQALGIWNTLEHFKQAQGVFMGIRIFVWVIGIMTIIAGIVGVSNIMIILVKERTKEIGIRKAIGATPWSVIRLVLSESVFITTLSGFFGLVAGMGLLAAVSMVLQNIAEGNPGIERSFYNPTADLSVAVSALVVLIVAGLIAGYVPARRASGIKPIEALHDE
ncbi:ABC transporter permease [Marinilabilia rubra]|uniref:ABC transporter permease n=1 Tax=Marinilabilia rubra TaxID=2162893 RepID=A0A2U2BBT8_9BACT|nr:ABC transporter permease [Marinilabilia rubra]PWE00530.1 ABC transporter permease [Marinilabilia rubra]